MPEDRGRQYHRERLSEALREEIATIIEGELEDPRIGLATVSELHLSPDGRAAHVLVAVSGSEQEAVDTLEGLTSARNYIRRTVAERLRLRTAPELHFRLDKSEQYGARIDELLRRLSKNRKKA
jgi:ribosome-binding factor A